MMIFSLHSSSLKIPHVIIFHYRSSSLVIRRTVHCFLPSFLILLSLCNFLFTISIICFVIFHVFFSNNFCSHCFFLSLFVTVPNLRVSENSGSQCRPGKSEQCWSYALKAQLATWARPKGEAIALQGASESVPKTMTERDNLWEAVELKHGTEVDLNMSAPATL